MQHKQFITDKQE